jgi:spore coat polysaccharide biosynthesis predicted glycosyltransferase SpsG
MKTVWLASSSTKEIGLGHLSRCVAIAEELRTRRYVACFNHLSLLDYRGLELLHQSEFRNDCICENQPSFMIIDSYLSEFIKSCTQTSSIPSVLMVDELSPRIWADYYVEASPIKDWTPLNAKAGVFKFNCNPILRSVFDEPVAPKNLSPLPRRFLISLGSAANESEILRALVPLIQDLSVNPDITILSNNSPATHRLQELYGHNLRILENVQSLKELLDDIDFVISAGGVTAWELISLNVPGMLVGVAENQFEQIHYLQINDLRAGVIFQNGIQFQKEFLRLFNQIISKSRSEAFEQSRLRNGRKEFVSWIMDIMKYSQT